jgi:hypothetical protein
MMTQMRAPRRPWKHAGPWALLHRSSVQTWGLTAASDAMSGECQDHVQCQRCLRSCALWLAISLCYFRFCVLWLTVLLACVLMLLCWMHRRSPSLESPQVEVEELAGAHSQGHATP